VAEVWKRAQSGPSRVASVRSQIISGHPAIPPSRRLLAFLAETAPRVVPAALPSDFPLELSVAPQDFAEALAVAELPDAEGDDLLVALLWLGDHASSQATPALLSRLRTAVDEQQFDVVSLALRALLRADLSAARLEATRLLVLPAHFPAAAGVLALSDPRLDEELGSLDLEDGVAVAEARSRILRLLANSHADEAVREAAEANLMHLQGASD